MRELNNNRIVDTYGEYDVDTNISINYSTPNFSIRQLNNYYNGYNGNEKKTYLSYGNSTWGLSTTATPVYIYVECDCQVTFDSNGAASGVLKQGFSKGETKALMANKYAKEGYTFMGWSTTKEGAVEYEDGASYTANGNATLYAVWQEDYEVTFDANGGEGTMGIQKFKPNVAQKLASNEFTNGEYFFVGWSTTKDGQVEYENGANYTATSDITLYAKWSEGVSYTVRHWQQTLSGGDEENSDNYVLMSGDTQTLKGVPNGSVTPSTLTYTGFVSPSRKKVKVYEDGSTVVDYYYKRELYYVDLNAVVNGNVYNSCTITGNTLGTADFYVNGELILSGATDIYSQWRYGSTYEFKNITASSNCKYNGLNTTYSNAELTGTITKTTTIYLNFSVENKFNGWVNLNHSAWTTKGGNTDTVKVALHHGGTLSAKSSSSSVSVSMKGTTANISGLNNLSVGSKVRITITSSETAIYKSASATYVITIGNLECGCIGCNTVVSSYGDWCSTCRTKCSSHSSYCTVHCPYTHYYNCKCSECSNTVTTSGATCSTCSSYSWCTTCSGYVCKKHCQGHTTTGGDGGGSDTPITTPAGEICGTCGGDGRLPCRQSRRL